MYGEIGPSTAAASTSMWTGWSAARCVVAAGAPVACAAQAVMSRTNISGERIVPIVRLMLPLWCGLGMVIGLIVLFVVIGVNRRLWPFPRISVTGPCSALLLAAI